MEATRQTFFLLLIFLTSIGAKKQEKHTGTCALGTQCASGMCLGGYCCTSPKGTSDGCTACSAAGDCKVCGDDGYKRVENACKSTTNKPVRQGDKALMIVAAVAGIMLLLLVPRCFKGGQRPTWSI